MRSAILIAALALSITNVSAYFGKGACPAVTNYPYDVTMLAFRDHNLLYMDAFAVKVMDLGRKVVAAIPDLKCLALGNFPYDQPTYDSFFVDPARMLPLQLAYFHLATLTEIWYMCIDYAFIANLAGNNIWARAALQVITPLHYEVGLVMTQAASFTNAEIVELNAGLQATVPTYKWTDLAMFDRALCP